MTDNAHATTATQAMAESLIALAIRLSEDGIFGTETAQQLVDELKNSPDDCVMVIRKFSQCEIRP
ncbi:hypothetical protein GCM10012285_27820 [Streptomyces kronopolitis]|uniref:Uncharacterized protein n=1 Tax=Streptomyces kronopolitis TaxID=1612435 RepID=A0ABQ2JFN3_9ACTN|nr:hypothetical protein [Streptomyces kronopolitis]GGN44830.1 hypothetical protein GCM10012285_27820 [Streptomyces kronopolitis]